MIIITAIPNYNNALNTSFVCNTKVIESIRGREYRVGSVTRPLVTQRFTVSNLSKPLTQKFITWRNSRGESAVAMPVWLDAVYLQGGAKKNDLSLVCAAKYRLFQWFKYAIILYDSDTYEVTMIRKPIASNESLALEYKVSRDYPKGSVVAPLAFGKMLLPELGYYTPSISELMLEFEERVAIDINIIRDGSGNPVGVETDGEGGLVQSDTPVGIIEHFPIISPETDPDPDDPANNPPEQFEAVMDEPHPLFDIYAGAAVCSHGYINNYEGTIEDGQNRRYRAPAEEGCFSPAPHCGLVIVAGLFLVKKEGVSDDAAYQADPVEVTVKCTGYEDEVLSCSYGTGPAFVVFYEPVELESGDRPAYEDHIQGNGEPWEKTTKRVLEMVGFEGARYVFNPTLKSRKTATAWHFDIETSETSYFWAGTATLGALES